MGLKRRRIEEDEARRISSPANKEIDKLERQGLQVNCDVAHQWQSTQGSNIRKKTASDLQPTNPHADIKGTGSCTVWVREVELELN
jgi:calcineurin-like phosphoesterase